MSKRTTAQGLARRSTLPVTPPTMPTSPTGGVEAPARDPGSLASTGTRTSIRRKKPLDASEADWGRTVEQWADLHGWVWFHVPDSRRMRAGLPDYVMVRASRGTGPGRLLFAEIKAPGGRVRSEQMVVLSLLATVPGVEYGLFELPEAWPRLRDLLL